MVLLAIAKLIELDHVEKLDTYDHNQHENYISMEVTDVGRSYILRSYVKLQQEEILRLSVVRPTEKVVNFADLHDDVPF